MFGKIVIISNRILKINKSLRGYINPEYSGFVNLWEYQKSHFLFVAFLEIYFNFLDF